MTQIQKNRHRPKKLLFSKFSLLLHIYPSRQNFFVITKISYLQPFREIMWGQRKALHRTTTTTTNEQTNDERRTTNDERRTTNDDELHRRS